MVDTVLGFKDPELIQTETISHWIYILIGDGRQ